MNVSDIEGTKSRRLYRGVAKNILSNSDIDGSMPRAMKVSAIIRLLNFKSS